MAIKRIDDYRWEVPRTGDMHVPGRVYATAEMLSPGDAAEPLKQVANVACLPGIVTAALAMPDMHWGYGFPIGGVAAFDWETGVVSPGGVGYDINCGVRLASTDLPADAVRKHLEALADGLYRHVPCGVGATGPVKLSQKEEKRVLTDGSRWAVENGFGTPADLAHTEDGGCLPGAEPSAVSDRALTRGRQQLGTLGSGNHFLEVGEVETVYDADAAAALGLHPGQVTVMIHSGSRGFGYQVCDDFLSLMNRAGHDIGIPLPDRQLVCAPLDTDTARQYLAAMACAANYAWANRQVLLHFAREVFMRVLGIGPTALGMDLVYDVCHNIAKKERHSVDGNEKWLCVHRKGATRSFGPDHPALDPSIRSMGQPVIVPGDMGTASYVMVGTATAMAETFGSTCHGAGRVLSRKAAIRRSKGRDIHRELAERGILVRWTGRHTLKEEMPEAYKDVSAVVNVVHGAGISRKVARLRPLVVIKG